MATACRVATKPHTALVATDPQQKRNSNPRVQRSPHQNMDSAPSSLADRTIQPAHKHQEIIYAMHETKLLITHRFRQRYASCRSPRHGIGHLAIASAGLRCEGTGTFVGLTTQHRFLLRTLSSSQMLRPSLRRAAAPRNQKPLHGGRRLRQNQKLINPHRQPFTIETNQLVSSFTKAQDQLRVNPIGLYLRRSRVFLRGHAHRPAHDASVRSGAPRP